MTGQPSERVKALIRARAQDRCERCGCELDGWDGGSYHHRRVKGMGGDKRPDTNQAANLLLLCGSGTTGCHGWAHHDTTGQARAQGWLVSRWAVPAAVPVALALHGRVRLADDGTTAPPPLESEGGA